MLDNKEYNIDEMNDSIIMDGAAQQCINDEQEYYQEIENERLHNEIVDAELEIVKHLVCCHFHNNLPTIILF